MQAQSGQKMSGEEASTREEKPCGREAGPRPRAEGVPGTFAFNSGSAPLPILSFSTSWQKVLFWPHHSQQCLSPGLSIL